MKVLVCGATGCIGRTVAHALQSRGHAVIAAARSLPEAGRTWQVDFMRPRTPDEWAARLRAAHVDAVVNCVGMLRPGRHTSFGRVHAQAPVELFRGAAQAGLHRIVQVSALGVRDAVDARGSAYLLSKLQADEALAVLPIESAVVRPSLVYGPGSASAALFTTLAGLPVIALPGGGRQPVQPVHVYEVGEAIVRLLERREPLGCGMVCELGGPQALSYRDMLAAYRDAQGLGPAWWVPVPMPLMQLGARLAEWLPQRVLSRDTLNLLERGNTTDSHAAASLLGREPTAMPDALTATPPQPLLDLGVRFSPFVERLLRASLAVLWLATALITIAWPHASGVLQLLARGGLEGIAGVAVMAASCLLNVVLGVLVLWRPGPAVYACQIGAVLRYSITAGWFEPALVLDHCGPLLKNLPVLALLVVLWLAHGRGMAGPLRPAARRTASHTLQQQRDALAHADAHGA